MKEYFMHVYSKFPTEPHLYKFLFGTLRHPPDDFTWVLFSKARLDVETSYGHKHA